MGTSSPRATSSSPSLDPAPVKGATCGSQGQVFGSLADTSVDLGGGAGFLVGRLGLYEGPFMLQMGWPGGAHV